jgi:hypothetical protein
MNSAARWRAILAGWFCNFNDINRNVPSQRFAMESGEIKHAGQASAETEFE